MSSKDELIRTLGEALCKASDHLDYCGYGDNWERECAVEQGLEEEIEGAVGKYKEHIK